MKKKIITIAIVALVVIADAVVLSYPTLSAYINNLHQSRAVTRYVDEVATMDPAKRQAMIAAADAYNKTLLTKADRFKLSAEDTAQYDRLLNTGSGVMSMLVIDKINVKLPVYHGTDAAVLQVGVGHLPGSSLPVGGKGTHAVISGHRGLPSATLLTNLDKMTKGDTFVLYTMGETLTYQVDQIKTVLPDNVEALSIDPAQDYCTLVTCTPYGINTHRLLVRGHRIPNAPNMDWSNLHPDASWLDKARMILLFISPALAGLLTYTLLRGKKIRRTVFVGW
ncbi:MAG: class C sortase [Coriobacteriia bacterium]|nr:class C sortase [Coriobacteriia bacterium]